MSPEKFKNELELQENLSREHKPEKSKITEHDFESKENKELFLGEERKTTDKVIFLFRILKKA